MITEKTVELNLTMELINHMSWRDQISYYALAPSQAAEAKLGFDAAIGGSGYGVLIQYKRAILKGSNTLEYHINYTKNEDQHKLLLDLEAAGIPVFYALPLFTTAPEIAANRRRLLLNTVWPTPSSFALNANPIGKHEVFYDRTTGVWTRTSENRIDLADLVREASWQDVSNAFRREVPVAHCVGAFNAVVSRLFRQGEETVELAGSAGIDWSIFEGMSLLASDPSHHFPRQEG